MKDGKQAFLIKRAQWQAFAAILGALDLRSTDSDSCVAADVHRLCLTSCSTQKYNALQPIMIGKDVRGVNLG